MKRICVLIYKSLPESEQKEIADQVIKKTLEIINEGYSSTYAMSMAVKLKLADPSTVRYILNKNPEFVSLHSKALRARHDRNRKFLSGVPSVFSK